MNYIKVLLPLLIICFLSSKNIYAQETNNTVTVGPFIGTCEYKVGDGDWQVLKYGDKIPETADVRVSGKNDNLELDFPDGSSVNIIGLSSVKIGNIMQDYNNKKRSVISLLMGKIFAKVKKSDNQDFRVETQTAVAAVRGTRFGVSFYPDQGGSLVVSEGAVAVFDSLEKLQPVLVKEGFLTKLPINPGDAPSIPEAASIDQIKEFDSDYKAPVKPEEIKPQTPVQPVPAPVENPAKTEKPGKTEKACSDEGINWSVSAESIDNSVWNKILFDPAFKFGDFSFGLYLPIYYHNLDDVFYPNKWYNNNEWDFTSWQDSAHDLLLKIKFIQYQNKNILLNIGTIPSITIGHGFMIDKYANDLQFPALRKVGFQLNVDFGAAGFESMMGDVFLTKLMGGRLFVRPFYSVPFFGNLGLGFSGFTDLDPLEDGKRKVYGYGTDIDLPILQNQFLSSTLYSDGATLGYSDSVLETNVYQKGLGITGGFKGTIAIFDYKAEYRYIKDGFIPNYVDKYYDIDKEEEYLALVTDSTNDYNGWLFEIGKNFEGIGSLSLGYQQYYPIVFSTNSVNFLHIEASINKCLFKKAYGSISYDKKDFDFTTLFNNFFGNGAVVTTQIFYQIADGAYVGINYKKYFQSDSSGNITEKSTYSLQTEIQL